MNEPATRRLRLPFTYMVRGRLLRGRTISSHPVMDFVAVDVPLVSSSDAPVVLRTRPIRDFASDALEMRSYGGACCFAVDRISARRRHWRKNEAFGHPIPARHAEESAALLQTLAGGDPARRRIGDRIAVDMTADTIDDLVAGAIAGEYELQWPRYPLPMHTETVHPSGRLLMPIERRLEDFAAVAREDRAECLALAQEGASRFLFVDGVLHIREPEPFIQYKTTHSEERGHYIAHIAACRDDDEPVGGSAFGIGRLGDANRLADAAWDEFVADEFEIDPAHVWEKDANRFEIRHWARSSMLALTRSAEKVLDLDDAFLEDLMELRAISEGRLDVGLDQLLVLIERMRSSADRQDSGFLWHFGSGVGLVRLRIEMFGDGSADPLAVDLDDLSL